MKADVTDELLIETIRQCMIGQVVYSQGVKNVLSLLAKRQLMQQEQYIEILMLLDKGYKVQEICEIVFKSQSTVQRMLTTMKKEFEVNDLSELLKQVKLQGFI
ncbi:DNA-binding NarL/FixJ family response regulator [Myroides gitamensis]|nr:DNA-binding NarL/FixJ family response regulator [Myroides gitamensis]